MNDFTQRRNAAIRRPRMFFAAIAATFLALSSANAEDVLIEKIVIERSPISHVPYFVSCTASYGSFESEPVTSGSAYRGAAEVPLNILVRNVTGASWIKLEVRLDSSKEAAATFKALEQHTARFQMLYANSVSKSFTPFDNIDRHWTYVIHARKK
jgi:hypothetical protein